MTKDLVIKIKGIYEKMAEEAKAANEQKGSIIKNAAYSDQGKAEQIAIIQANLETSLHAKIEEINALLERIKKEESKRADEFSPEDTAFMNSCILLNMGAVPAEVAEKIFNSFKGRKQYLLVFKQILSVKEIPGVKIEKYIINTDDEINEIIDANGTIAKDLNSTVYKIVACYKELIKITEALGIWYVEYDRSLNVDVEKELKAFAASVMGV